MGEDWGTKSVEAGDGNVFLYIDYGAALKQGAERIDSRRHHDGLQRVIEEAATALQHYKNA